LQAGKGVPPEMDGDFWRCVYRQIAISQMHCDETGCDLLEIIIDEKY